MTGEHRRMNTKKIKDAISTLIARIEKGEKDKPSISLMVPFNIFKYISQVDRENMPADYEYYKEKGDYYYDARIPAYKKFVAKRVSDKIISQFD